MDSKGFISTAFITNVNAVGDVKFEVVTNNRTFVFRAESEGVNTPEATWLLVVCSFLLSVILVSARRNSWVTALQDCTAGRHLQGSTSMLPTPDYQGYLDLRGFRGKHYAVVASDKVFLYKTIEVLP